MSAFARELQAKDARIAELENLANMLLSNYKTATHNHPDDTVRQGIIREANRVLNAQHEEQK